MIIEIPQEIPPAEELGRVHFIGIGGAALSGLARIMVARGVEVSGSDAQDSPLLEGLRALGVRCDVGHRAEQVEHAHTVVVSTAISADNAEVARAFSLHLRVWPRAAAVQSVMLGRTAVVVTGTHGKTTTTSMLTTALLSCGADPSYAIGSTLNTSGLNAAAGQGGLFIAEGDESDEAILAYTPNGAVVTNIDVDHLDHFGTAAAYASVFDTFVTRIIAPGFLVCCVDDPGAARLADSVDKVGELTVVRVGTSDGVDLWARAIAYSGQTSTFDVWDGAKSLGEVTLQVPGQSYVVDALAALAAGLELGFGFDELAIGLAGFRGTGRRMELKGEAGGIRVVDSYAHHPTEIASDLQAARAVAGGGRVLVCYQPHLYSRTRIFGAAMGRALGAADEVVVLDVYAAREQPEEGVDGSLVSAAVPLPAAQVLFEPDRAVAVDELAERARPGDLVLTMGAGDVTALAPELLVRLAERTSHPGEAER